VTILLSDRWAPVLLRQPETGMGYQVVTIVLKDGRKVENVTVSGGAISDLPPEIASAFTEADIEDILVTHAQRVRPKIV